MHKRFPDIPLPHLIVSVRRKMRSYRLARNLDDPRQGGFLPGPVQHTRMSVPTFSGTDSARYVLRRALQDLRLVNCRLVRVMKNLGRLAVFMT